MTGKPTLRAVWKIGFSIACFLFFLFAESFGHDAVFMRENFDTHGNWEHYSLFDDVQPTKYTFEKKGRETYLKAESKASSSALLCKIPFDVYAYPNIRWRWKVDNVYERENLETKAGNDAPARVCILFEYDPQKAGLFQRIRYSLAKKKIGEYPPDSGLCYAWASRAYKKRAFRDPKWKIVQTVILEHGAERVGTWREATVNAMEDYQRAFRKSPPARARIAIMNDSNNTGEASISYFTSLEVFR